MTFSSSSTSSQPKHVVVIGGNGYVGSAVCKQAIASGLRVTSINRSGPPKQREGEDWVKKVDWVTVDASDVDKWAEKALKSSAGVISCLGTFGSDEQMFRINGEANVRIAEKVKEYNVPRFVYVSVHNYAEDRSLPSILDAGKSEKGWGYFRGKRYCEEKLKEIFKNSNRPEEKTKDSDGGLPYYVLRPGFISGTRVLPTGHQIPLWLIGKPLQMVTNFLPPVFRRIPLLGAGFVPPVEVENVGKVAVQLIVNPTSFSWGTSQQIVDVDMINSA